MRSGLADPDAGRDGEVSGDVFLAWFDLQSSVLSRNKLIHNRFRCRSLSLFESAPVGPGKLKVDFRERSRYLWFIDILLADLWLLRFERSA
ncbi:hypothetical protein ASG19_16450 [Rhizobium sp. Leaf306]|jgi:hypothetical protein|nr:hypothetical protein ASG19_16450 [Rhizobium sp. Leaf306]KQQ75085.1 hypothetical protein ASF70_04190 [Rhizobium sp. Leaf321]